MFCKRFANVASFQADLLRSLYFRQRGP